MPAPVKAAYGTKEFYQEIGRRGGVASARARAERVRLNIMAELQLLVAEAAGLARENAWWSTDISRAISVSEVYNAGDELACDILVDLGKAPQARAFEYGSGLHGKYGETYKITPKNAPALAFPFTLRFLPGPKFIRMAGIETDARLVNLINIKGKVSGLTFWNYVDHPGVEERPYLAPAIKAIMPKMKEKLGEAFKRAFVGGFFNEAQ